MLFCLIGFFGIVIAGTIGHFVYDLLCRVKHVAWAVPINESTWEHLKLVVMPMLAWYLIGFVTVKFNNYSFGVFVAILVACILIPLIFYTYTEFTKKTILAVDIASYIIAVGLACLTAYSIFHAQPLPQFFNMLGMLGIIIIFIMFVVFTYFTPQNFLFKDPITNKYGLAAQQPNKVPYCKKCA